jgi:hypothetical protein
MQWICRSCLPCALAALGALAPAGCCHFWHHHHCCYAPAADVSAANPLPASPGSPAGAPLRPMAAPAADEKPMNEGR